MFNGIGSSMENLFLLSNAKSRSITAENFKGEKGKGGMAETGIGAESARDLGVTWKISPSIIIQPGETACIADIEGPGAINHIWLTATETARFKIIRIYWDDNEEPSVECPLGDFFAAAYKGYSQISSLPVCVNPANAYNCYWVMPFKKRCRITVENLESKETMLYYQVDYTLNELPENIAYFHAQFRRVNPLPYKEVCTILDNVKGRGQYVGTYLAWGVNNNGWWGEGEAKFYIDGDEYPTICGTGTEDYFCGSYCFEVAGKYQEFTTPYAGLAQISKPDGLYLSQQRFSMYRWHITDPIRFEEDIRVTIQALGWREGHRYLPLQDDIASVAFWYQTLPFVSFPKLPSKDELEII